MINEMGLRIFFDDYGYVNVDCSFKWGRAMKKTLFLILAIAVIFTVALPNVAMSADNYTDLTNTTLDGAWNNYAAITNTNNSKNGMYSDWYRGNPTNKSTGVINTSGSSSYGIYVAAGGVATNEGSITTSGGNSNGMRVTSEGEAVSGCNSGTITVSGSSSRGVYAQEGSTFTNTASGVISVLGGTTDGIGILLYINAGINNGSISAAGSATGMHANRASTATNNGTITVASGMGMYSVGGLASTSTNNGTITVTNGGTGMYADTTHNIINNGTINVSGGGRGMTCFHSGTKTNTGTITVTGDGGCAAYARLGNTFNNSGTLSATGVGSYAMYAGANGGATETINFLPGTVILAGAVFGDATAILNLTPNAGETFSFDTSGFGQINLSTAGAYKLTAASSAVAVTLSGTSTLDASTNTMTCAGTYTQGANTTLKLTAKSSLSYGKVSTSSAASVDTGSAVSVTVGGYIPNNASLTVIDTAGTGVSNVPGAITSSSQYVTFTGAATGNNLVLTANRSASGFQHTASNSSASIVGSVLDNVTNPTADMTTVLNTLEGLSTSQTSSALDTLTPVADASVLNTSSSIFNNFKEVCLQRVQSILSSTKNPTPSTGISSGDQPKSKELWAKGYGSYLDQDTRKGIAGYTAWNAGTAMGIDRLVSDSLTLGISGGYANGNIDSDINNATTSIDSGQAALYSRYENENSPYFIDAAGTFGWNWYDAKRDITVGTLSRKANAEYQGQEYGLYLGTGYKINTGNKLILTPVVSFNYTHLYLQSYTETGADALSLSVASQDYDQLQSGLGAKIEYPVKTKHGILTTELYGRWLYDFVGDTVQTTSAFQGGGSSFETNGAKPAQSSFNLGGKLSLNLKNDITLIGECSSELKDEFWGIYGSATVKYEF